MQRRIFLLFVWAVCAAGSHAQVEVTGVVKDADTKESLPFSTIQVLNTSIGVSADIDGRFAIQANEADTLIISFLGYEKKRVGVGGGSFIELFLKPDNLLDEVVVTALGISREEKSLGYSVAKMDVKSATTIRDANVVNSMQGKIAGVNITKTSGGPASSSRIVIRGNSSVNSGNQPLIVVDGIPIDNQTQGNAGTWGGLDYGSPISDINPDDIESMNVLKGPSAAVLYGSRALNGVIIITTKKGSGKGWSYSLNSTSSIESAYVLKAFQNKYGAGSRGQFALNGDSIPFFQTMRPSTPTYASSWGPEMLGQTYMDWDSSMTTFSPQPDNYKDFFQIGSTFTNSISAQKGGKFPIRLSFTDLRNKGVSPTETFKRSNINVSVLGPLSKKLSFALKFSYANQRAFNRVNQSNGHNAARNIIMMPRNVSNSSLQNFEDASENEQTWYRSWGWIGNPYFTLNRNVNYDDRKRTLGNFSLTHATSDWMRVTGRIGVDRFNENRHSRIASRSFTSPNGEFYEDDIAFLEVNADYLVSLTKKLGKSVTFDADLGGNAMRQKRETLRTSGRNLIAHGAYTIDNTLPADRDSRTVLSEIAINSAYASARLAYRGYLFLELSGRNDWSSTLPDDNNSFFYPSVSTSYVLSEHLKLPEFVSLAKIRGAVAWVGNDSSPYLTSIVYDSLQVVNGGQYWSLGGQFPLVNLMPERKRSYEIGADIRLFKGRVQFDATYYFESTINQIISGSPVSPTTGYNTAVVNAGRIDNKGWELLMQTTPIDKTIRWTNILNFTRNRNIVKSLSSDGQRQILADQWRVNVIASPGLPYGTIVGYGIQRDESGSPLLSADGTFLRTEEQIILGDINPDWKLGITNGIAYKNWNMSFLVDIQKGGDIYSATNMYMHGYAGNATATLEGRAEWYASEAAREDAGVDANGPDGSGGYSIHWDPTGGYSVSGVYADGTVINGEDVSGQSVSRFIDPQTYWSQHAAWTNEIHEPFVYDASFVKLRELGISYSFAKKLFNEHVDNLTLTLSGRNLWLIFSNIPNVDPEATYTNGNGQGVEYATYPITRSIGFNLKANF